ncbi:c-type cytochrome [Bacillus sp. SCS-153A]|uniref:c-type cytochrome n=1 Tax=Rossellomorea sedimentorum TaxID=3115294 RepID=UPI003905FA42
MTIIFKLIQLTTRTILFLVIIGLIIFKSLQGAMYFLVAKPEAEELAYDVASYVEANGRFFDESSLQSYFHNYKMEHLDVRIKYIQAAYDKRFSVDVAVTAYWEELGLSSSASVQIDSVNFGETPQELVFAIFENRPSEEITENTKTEKSMTQENVHEQTDIQEVNTTQADQQKESRETAPSRNEISIDTIKKFTEEYVVQGMQAIKYNDFSYIKNLLDPESNIYEQSQNSIKDINSRGITEELLTFKATDVVKEDDSHFKVSTYEEYKINKPESSSIKGFNSKYLVRVLDGSLLVMKSTLEITEVFSQEVQDTYEGQATDILKKRCFSCHGNSLEGGMGPTLYNLKSKYSHDEVVDILINGQGAMPGGLVSDEEAERVAEYLRGL